ncbi:MAG: hypothetical protein ABJB40_04750 [Acidobacteriota bacterium]
MSESLIPPRFRAGHSKTPEPGADEDPPDPAIEALLGFEPVSRKIRRHDGWTPDLQREFIRQIVVEGSPQRAAVAMRKRLSGIEELYRQDGADSFRAAWDAALELAADRQLAAMSERIDAGIAVEPPTAAQPPPDRRHSRRTAKGTS